MNKLKTLDKKVVAKMVNLSYEHQLDDKKIEELKSQNIHLQKEKEFYKSNLEKVPNFMAKLLKIKKEY